jgi:hypothetical protein
MKLTVKSSVGVGRLEADDVLLVEAFKSLVEQATGIPKEEQRIFYSGKEVTYSCYHSGTDWS